MLVQRHSLISPLNDLFLVAFRMLPLDVCLEIVKPRPPFCVAGIQRRTGVAYVAYAKALCGRLVVFADHVADEVVWRSEPFEMFAACRFETLVRFRVLFVMFPEDCQLRVPW